MDRKFFLKKEQQQANLPKRWPGMQKSSSKRRGFLTVRRSRRAEDVEFINPVRNAN